MEKTYIVEGMSCDGCANAVERSIKDSFPAATVRVDIHAKCVTVEGIIDDSMVQKAVEKAGYIYGGSV
jgi:copper chaperone